MGVIDVEVGYGFSVDVDYDFENHINYDPEKHIDLWNFLDDQITANFPYLEHNVERYGDIRGCGAVFAKSSITRWYGAETLMGTNLNMVSSPHLEQLTEAAKFLGIPPKFGYVAITMFG